MKHFIIILLLFSLISISSAEVQSTVSIDNLAIDKESIAITHIKIEANDASGLSAATIKVSFNPNIVQLLNIENGDFDAYIHNINNELGYVIMVAYQMSFDGVQPGSIQFADLELKAVGVEGSESALSIEVDSITNNTGILVPYQIKNGIFRINGEPPKENIIMSSFSSQDKLEVTSDGNEEHDIIIENLPNGAIPTPTSNPKNKSNEIVYKSVEFIPGFSILVSFLIILIIIKIKGVGLK